MATSRTAAPRSSARSTWPPPIEAFCPSAAAERRTATHAPPLALPRAPLLPLARAPLLALARAPHDQPVQQLLGHLGDPVHRLGEDLGVRGSRGAHPRDLADVLQCGRLDVLGSGILRVGRAQCL